MKEDRINGISNNKYFKFEIDPINYDIKRFRYLDSKDNLSHENDIEGRSFTEKSFNLYLSKLKDNSSNLNFIVNKGNEKHLIKNYSIYILEKYTRILEATGTCLFYNIHDYSLLEYLQYIIYTFGVPAFGKEVLINMVFHYYIKVLPKLDYITNEQISFLKKNYVNIQNFINGHNFIELISIWNNTFPFKLSFYKELEPQFTAIDYADLIYSKENRRKNYYAPEYAFVIPLEKKEFITNLNKYTINLIKSKGIRFKYEIFVKIRIK